MILRSLDLIISSLLIITFFPLLLLLSLIIFFQDFNNPIFSSIRIGKNKKKFKLYKLRTMRINSEGTKVRTTRISDPRITYFGKWIRRYKLDELTQLWNVIINDMSIVGPRPNVEEEIKFYKDSELKLFDYKPGITDYASIWFINLENRMGPDNNKDVNKEYLVKIKPLKNFLAMKTINNLGIYKYLYVCVLTAIALFHLKFAKKLIIKNTRSK